jgi:tRNA (guanosine-2'-O-)-methyltransferase
MLTDARRERFLKVVSQRTRHIRLVIQDIHEPHNVSACLRSAEAFGVQDCDVVTMTEKFKPTGVAKGVNSWLKIERYVEIASCVKNLRANGYKIVAGVPVQTACRLDDLPVKDKIAVVFGNEHDGIAKEWLDHVDYPFTIPMVGHVESLNISVSAAVTLHSLTMRARNLLPASMYLISDIEQKKILNEWVCNQFRSWEVVLERLREKRL